MKTETWSCEDREFSMLWMTWNLESDAVDRDQGGHCMLTLELMRVHRARTVPPVMNVMYCTTVKRY
jgi:hypothetical protein